MDVNDRQFHRETTKMNIDKRKFDGDSDDAQFAASTKCALGERLASCCLDPALAIQHRKDRPLTVSGS
jgi:hypothetical protein